MVPLPAPDGPSIAMTICFIRSNRSSLVSRPRDSQHDSRAAVRSRPMRRRLLTLAIAVVVVFVIVAYVAAPYARATSLVVRAANLGGRAQAFATGHAFPVTVNPRQEVNTRYGYVPVRFYTIDTPVKRSI